MDTMYNHICIKPACGNKYTENDPDPYYCFDCRKEKEALAKRIDKKFQTTENRSAPSFQEQIDAMPKLPGTNIPFIQ